MFDTSFLHDMAERAISTYIQAFLGFLVAAQVVDFSTVRVAAISAVPAVLSVLKSIIAARFNPAGGASEAAIV